MTIQSQPIASTYSCEAIYRKISDLTNLEEVQQLLEEKQVKVVSLSSDRCEVQAPVMKFSADLALVVSERIPTEAVSYTHLSLNSSEEIFLSSLENDNSLPRNCI